MIPNIIRPVRVAALALAMLALVGSARAQEPSANAVAMAKELIQLKGAQAMWEPIIPGVLEQAKGVLLQTNPGLVKDLNEVTAKLRTELAPRRDELFNDVARLYAQRFTEAELKDALAFYKTPLGKKLIAEEPRVLDESVTRMQQWANRFSEDVLARIRSEMKKRGHNL